MVIRIFTFAFSSRPLVAPASFVDDPEAPGLAANSGEDVSAAGLAVAVAAEVHAIVITADRAVAR